MTGYPFRAESGHKPQQLIVYPVRQDPARLGERDPLKFEQSALHLLPTLKSAQLTVGPDGPVTGNDDGEGIVRQGSADCPRPTWGSQMSGDPPVGAYPASRHLVLCQENALLKVRTGLERDKVQLETKGLALEEALNALTQLCDGRARARAGASKASLDQILHWSALIRQHDSMYPGACSRLLPHNAQGAESRWQQDV
jgi:hypothetical protein